MATAGKSLSFVVPPQVVAQHSESSNNEASTRPAKSRIAKPKEPQYTIEQAFNDGYEGLNLEKAIRPRRSR